MTSWTNSTPIMSATPRPAEPVTAQWKVSCGKAWATSDRSVRRAPRASALCRLYELKRSASRSSTTALTVVDPTSRPSESNGSSDQNDRSVPGQTVTEPHSPKLRTRSVCGPGEDLCASGEDLCGSGEDLCPSRSTWRHTNAASLARDGAV